MQKRVFIIHGWGGNPEEAWIPWLRQELVSRGFLVAVPPMPDSEHPQEEQWIQHLAEIVGHCDSDTYFVGHSLGCQAILRYLQSLPLPVKVGGAVFVGGFEILKTDTPEEERIWNAWSAEPIHWEAIRGRSNHFTAIFSDDDDIVPLENVKVFAEKLEAQTIVLHNKGHFSGGDGIMELPEAREALLTMIS